MPFDLQVLSCSIRMLAAEGFLGISNVLYTGDGLTGVYAEDAEFKLFISGYHEHWLVTSPYAYSSAH